MDERTSNFIVEAEKKRLALLSEVKAIAETLKIHPTNGAWAAQALLDLIPKYQ